VSKAVLSQVGSTALKLKGISSMAILEPKTCYVIAISLTCIVSSLIIIKVFVIIIALNIAVSILVKMICVVIIYLCTSSLIDSVMLIKLRRVTPE
jgi:hypothetical protein